MLMTTGCSEFALLTSGTSMAVSQNVYAKAYSGIDILTIMQTKKNIKGHLYDTIKTHTDETNETDETDETNETNETDENNETNQRKK